VRSQNQQKAEPTNFFRAHHRIDIQSRILGVAKRCLNLLLGVSRFWTRTSATHIAELRYTPPPIQYPPGFVYRYDRWLVIPVGVRRPLTLAQMACVFIEKDIQPTSLAAFFANLMMRVTDDRKMSLPFQFSLGRQCLGFAGNTENLPTCRMNFLKDTSLRIAS